MLIENPFENAMFLPTLYLWTGLLGVALVALLLLLRHRGGRLRDEVLFIRCRTWAIIAPIYLFAVLSGSLATVVLVMALTIQGLREYARLVGLAPTYEWILLLMGFIVAPVAALSPDGFYLLGPLLLILATLQPLLLGSIGGGVRQLAFAALGWGYIAWFLGHTLLLRQQVEGGTGILLALGLAVAVSDVCAFLVGKALGRRKLSPRLSPNKTVEGVLGNFVGAYGGLALMSFALPSHIRVMALVGLPILIGLGALWGDLVESALKREFGVKDAGGWLPGFGGLLDRIDSLLIVMPLSYYVFRIAM